MTENFVEMELREIQIVEDFSRTQIIVLGEKDGQRAFPIFIGLNEAMAMDLAARGERMPRPLTHDLVLNVVRGLDATLDRVLVLKLENDTFYGALELRTTAGETVRVDSRPSDAIVLATKAQAPIFVEENVLREVQQAAGLGADAEGAGDGEDEDVSVDLEFLGDDDEPGYSDNPDEEPPL